MTVDPTTSAAVRVLSLIIWAVLMMRTLRHRKAGQQQRRQEDRTRTASVIALFVMLAAITVGGLSQALKVTLPDGALTTLYTIAAFLAAATGGYWLWKGR